MRMRKLAFGLVLALQGALAAPPAPSIYMPAEGETDLILRPKIGMNFEDPGYFTGKFRVVDVATGSVHTPWTDFPFPGQTLFFWQLKDCLESGRRVELQVKLINTRTGEAGPVVHRRFRTRAPMGPPTVAYPKDGSAGVPVGTSLAQVGFDSPSTSSIVEVRRDNDGVVVRSAPDDDDGTVMLPALQHGATYTLSVKGANSCEQSPATTVRFTVEPLPAPAVSEFPSGATAGSSVTARVAPVTGATRYEWELRIAGGSSVATAQTATPSAQLLVPANATAALELRVRAVGPYSTSAWSAPRGLSPLNPLAKPSLTQLELDEEEFSVHWQSPAGASQHRIELLDGAGALIGQWFASGSSLCVESPAALRVGTPVTARVVALQGSWVSPPAQAALTPRAAQRRYELVSAPTSVSLGEPLEIQVQFKRFPQSKSLHLEHLSTLAGWTRIATWTAPLGQDVAPVVVPHSLAAAADFAHSGFYRLIPDPNPKDAANVTHFHVNVLVNNDDGLHRDIPWEETLVRAITLPDTATDLLAHPAVGFQFVGACHPLYWNLLGQWGSALADRCQALQANVFFECLPFTFNTTVRPLENLERLIRNAFANKPGTRRRQRQLAIKIDFFFHGGNNSWTAEYVCEFLGSVTQAKGNMPVRAMELLGSYGNQTTAAAYNLPESWAEAQALLRQYDQRDNWNTPYLPGKTGHRHFIELVRRADLLADFLLRLRQSPLYTYVKPRLVLLLAAELEKRNLKDGDDDPYDLACKIIHARLQARGAHDVVSLGFVRHGKEKDSGVYLGESHHLGHNTTSPGGVAISSNDGDSKDDSRGAMEGSDFRSATRNHLGHYIQGKNSSGRIFAAWHESMNLADERKSPWLRKPKAENLAEMEKEVQDVFGKVISTHRDFAKIEDCPKKLELVPSPAASLPTLAAFAKAEVQAQELPLEAMALSARVVDGRLELSFLPRLFPLRLEWTDELLEPDWQTLSVVPPGMRAVRLDMDFARGHFRLAALDLDAEPLVPEVSYAEGDVSVRWENETDSAVMETLAVGPDTPFTNYTGSASAHVGPASLASVVRWTSRDRSVTTLPLIQGNAPETPEVVSSQVEGPGLRITWRPEPHNHADRVRVERGLGDGSWVFVTEADPRESSTLAFEPLEGTHGYRLVFVNRFGCTPSAPFAQTWPAP